MPGYSVQTDFTADGAEVLGTLKAMAVQSKKTSDKMEAGFKRVGSVWKGSFVADLSARAVASGMNLAQRGIESVVKSYIDYDAAIRAAADAGAISLEVGSKEFAAFDAAARRTAETTKFTAAAAAGALEKFGLAGYDAAQAASALPYAVDLATASGLDLAAAAELETDALAAFGLTSTDAATQAQNLAMVNDLLAASADSSKLSTEELVGALKASGPGFAATGQSISTYTALLGKLADSGMDGADAGSKLSFMMKALAAPSDAAKKATSGLGISLYDEAGNVRDLVDFISDYDAATQEMSDAQRNALSATIFGKRGLDGVNAVLEIGTDDLKEYRDALKSAGGTAKKEAAVIEKTLGYKIDTLQNAAVEMGFKFIEAFAGDGGQAIDKFAESIKGFDVKPIVADAKDLAGTVKDVVGFLVDNTWAIKAAGIAFAGWKIAGLASDVVKMAGGMKDMVGAFGQNATKPISELGKAVEGVGGSAVAGGTAKTGGGKFAGVGAAAGSAIPVFLMGAAAGLGFGEALGGVSDTDQARTTKVDAMLRRMEFGQKWSGAGKGEQMTAADMAMALKALATQRELDTRDIMSFDTLIGHAASIFSATESPILAYARQQVLINELFGIMQERLKRANEQFDKLASSTANVNVTVGGPGAGSVTTTSTTSGPNAPAVNVNQAGKN